MPTLLLGGDPQRGPGRAPTPRGEGARAAGRARPGRRARAALSRRTATSRRAVDIAAALVHGVGPGLDDRGGPQWFRPSGVRPARRLRRAGRPTRSGWQHTGLRVRQPGRRRALVRRRPGRRVRRRSRWPVSLGRVHRREGRSTRPTAGPGSVFAGRTDVAYVPAGSSLDVTGTAAGSGRDLRGAGARRVGLRRLPARHRGGGPGRAARAPAAAPGRSATSARPDVLDATGSSPCEVVTPAGNWSLLPAAQARRAAGRGRGGARGDLLLRDQVERGPTAARPGRLPAGLRHRGAADRRARRGAHRRRRPRAARLARPVHGRARLRPVLPQRDGGPRGPSGPG